MMQHLMTALLIILFANVSVYSFTAVGNLCSSSDVSLFSQSNESSELDNDNALRYSGVGRCGPHRHAFSFIFLLHSTHSTHLAMCY
jgi:hypothetical protein